MIEVSTQASKRYENEIILVKNVLQWQSEKRSDFENLVKRLDPAALRAHVIILNKFLHERNINHDMHIFSPTEVLQLLSTCHEILHNRNITENLIDIIEILICTKNWSIDNQIIAENLFIDELKRKNEKSLENYFRLFDRLNIVFETGVSSKIFEALLKFMHTKDSDSQTFIQALIMSTSILEKKAATDENDFKRCLNVVTQQWNQCGQNKSDCSKCYAILSQFIKHSLNEQTINGFIKIDLLSLLRNGLMSSTILHRKQTTFILKNILSFLFSINKHESFICVGIGASKSREYIENAWESYFDTLETLIQIESQLILGVLDQYLEMIVEVVPLFWSSVIFQLIFKHHTIFVGRYGVNFVLDRKIYFHQQKDVQASLHNVWSLSILYSDDEHWKQEKFVNYILGNLNGEIEMMSAIEWKPLPAWILSNILRTVIANATKDDLDSLNVSNVIAFLKSSAKSLKKCNVFLDMDKFGEIVDEIFTMVGFKRIDNDSLLTLYEITRNENLFNAISGPIAMNEFISIFGKLKNLSMKTKLKLISETKLISIGFLRKWIEQNSHYLTNADLSWIFLYFHWRKSNNLSIADAFDIYKSKIYANLLEPHEPENYVWFSSMECLCSIVVDFLHCVIDKMTPDHAYQLWQSMFSMLQFLLEWKSSANIQLNKRIEEPKIEKITAIIKTQILSATGSNNLCSKTDLALRIREALCYSEYRMDLSRFDKSNANDLKAVEMILNSCVSNQQPHQVKNIQKILVEFPNVPVNSIERVFHMLVQHKCDVALIFQMTNSAVVQQFDKLLLECFLLGDELKSEKRVEYEKFSLGSSKLTYVQRVRLVAMNYVTARKCTEEIRRLKDLLFAENKNIYSPRHFNKSYKHSRKLRLTQALALLFRLDPVWDERIVEFIFKEVNQTNVKLINELIVAYTVDKWHLFDLIEYFERLESYRGIVSMFAIVYYVCCKYEDVSYAQKWIEMLSTFISSKQITVRVAAQITFLKLCEKFNVIENYSLMYDCLTKAIKRDDYSQKFMKVAYSSDLRTKHINCKELLSPIYVLYDMPRLTQFRGDEYYQNYEFNDIEKAQRIPMMAEEFVDRDVGDHEVVFLEVAKGQTNQNDHTPIQKKITPIHEMFISRQLLETLPPEFQNDCKMSGGKMIVVANLLSKASNVGGISRTTEVLGIGSLVIEGFHVLKKTDFTALSAGSEKWVNFIEVKEHVLYTYLLDLKSKGFSLIGAEQTTSGKYLNEFSFPEKMVLVVGNEKNGIPADIINILDCAVEIPQLGVVRSLNVHVTAAIFMWEYSKQHLMPNVNVSR